LPTVLSHTEALRVLSEVSGTQWLVAALLYGTGMRLAEGLGLRVKDLDFELGRITVRAGKGGRDRIVMLPESLVRDLRKQVVRAQPARRRSEGRWGMGGAAGGSLPKDARGGAGAGLAVSLSLAENNGRSAHGSAGETSPGPIGGPEVGS
jgi:integrase